MKLTEKILAALVLASLFMKFSLVPSGSVFFVVFISALMCLYFYSCFLLLNNIRLRKIFKREAYAGISALRITGAVCTGFSLATLLTGIEFKIMNWPGGNMYIVLGAVPGLIIALTALMKYMRSRDVFYKNILIRLTIILVCGTVLFFIPGMSLIRFQYRNHPSYVKAYIEYRQHPDDPELERKLDMEQMKVLLSPGEYQKYEESLNRPAQ
jgi:hypothetical protein